MAAKGCAKTGGREKGTPNKKTTALKMLALKEAPTMIKELARIAKHSENDATRVAAIKEIFDRAYGRPAQAITGEGGEGLTRFVGKIELVAPGDNDTD